MHTRQTPEESTHLRRTHRPARALLWVTIAAVLALLPVASGAWSMRQPSSMAASAFTPVLSVTPTAGAAGGTVSLSATGVARIYDTGTVSLTFDKTAISPVPGFVLCTSSDFFGFGSQCQATASYTYTIPAGTAPGTHSFELTSTVTGVAPLDITATFTVLSPAQLIVTPSSGPAGSSVALSALNIPAAGIVNGVYSLSLLLDQSAITPAPILAQCTSGGTYGFGTGCTGGVPYMTVIPLATAPGTYTFELIIRSVTGGPLEDLTAPFQVVAQATATATATIAATGTATPTLTTTATAAATATASSTTVPPTVTQAPLTSTPTPAATATRTATPTITPIPAPKTGALVSVVRPEFNRNVVAVFAKGSAGTKVHVGFAIVTGKTTTYATAVDKTLGSSGALSLNIKIHMTKYAPGRATLTITAVLPGGQTLHAQRVFAYAVSES